jgi:hypothetical protein
MLGFRDVLAMRFSKGREAQMVSAHAAGGQRVST